MILRTAQILVQRLAIVWLAFNAVAYSDAPAAVPAKSSALSLIDGTGPVYINNGSFEYIFDDLIHGGTAPSGWVATEFENPAITGPGTTTYRLQSNGNLALEGRRSQVFGVSNSNNVGQAPGLDVGYSVQQGDIFTLSFGFRGAFNWDLGDELDWGLFYTDDDTLSGERTPLFDGSVRPIPGVYDGTGELISPPATRDARGKRLFIIFTPGRGSGLEGRNLQDEFGRIDQVHLQVDSIVPEPSAWLLLLPSTIYLWWRVPKRSTCRSDA